MKTIDCNSSYWKLGVLTIAGILVVLANGGKAAAQLSDEMLITAPGGGPTIFDNFIPEVPGEPPLVFAGPPVPVAPPVPLAVAIGLPGATTVVLTEPFPDPGEPPVVIPGPNGPIFVSDIIISTLGVDPANNPGAPFIAMVSDGGPDLPMLAAMFPFPGLSVLAPETGLLQDFSAILAPAGPGNPFGPIGVQVRSDVPEPSTMCLAGLGLCAFGALAWRRRRFAR